MWLCSCGRLVARRPDGERQWLAGLYRFFRARPEVATTEFESTASLRSLKSSEAK